MMTKKKDCAEKAIRDIRRATRRQYSADEKIRIVLEGLQGSFKIAPGEFLFVSSMRLTLRVCPLRGAHSNLFLTNLYSSRP